jgi:hypothetical protein
VLSPEGRALGEGKVVERRQLQPFGQDQLPWSGLPRTILPVGVENIHGNVCGALPCCSQGSAGKLHSSAQNCQMSQHPVRHT